MRARMRTNDVCQERLMTMREVENLDARTREGGNDTRLQVHVGLGGACRPCWNDALRK